MRPEIFIMLGLAFGALAGLSAYLITYAEHKQRMIATSEARRRSLRAAIVAFLFFFVAALLFPWILQFVNRRG